MKQKGKWFRQRKKRTDKQCRENETGFKIYKKETYAGTDIGAITKVQR